MDCDRHSTFGLIFRRTLILYNIITIRGTKTLLKLNNNKEVLDISIMDLLAKVRSLKELETLIAEAQAELDSIKDELKVELTNRNTEELDVDVFKVRYKTVKFNRFDTTAFKSIHKDLYDQYVRQMESRSFTVA